MNTLTKKIRIIVFIVVALCLLSSIIFYPVLHDFVQYKLLVARYGGEKDFWSVYPTLKENVDFIRKNPANDSAYYSLGQGFFYIHGYDDAIDAFRHATDIVPTNDSYWSFLGKAYQAKKDYHAARDAYKKVLEVNPRVPSYFTQLAWLYYFRLDPEKEKAFEVLKHGLEKFPNDKDILFDITRFYLYDKNEAEFRKYAPRYLKIDPNQQLIKDSYEKGIQ